MRADNSRIRGRLAVAVVVGLVAWLPGLAQQLEPRAYSPSPVGTNFVGTIFTNSTGDILFDPSVPITDVSASVNAVIPFYVRTFGLFGRSASVAGTLPFVWGTVEGNVQGEPRNGSRAGLGDAGIRLAVNIVGAPALSPREFAARTPGTTLGASLTVTAPNGQYDSTRLVNIGTNRWAFKPELGFSQPLGKWWLELYAGVWLYTANDNFYGGSTRTQDPLTVLQAHVVYEFKPRWWIALDATWYGGGSTTVDGVGNADRQDNSRAGLTLAIPLPKRNTLKLAYARGATARVGGKMNTISVAWQFAWFDRSVTPVPNRTN